MPHTLVLLDSKILATLQKLGLTYYGAKVYATLVATGSTTATVLSTESEVPRTKIYDVLRYLDEGGWITVEKGRPTIYNPCYPREVLEEKRDLFYSEFDHCLNGLVSMYDQQIGKETYKISLIRGVDNIFAKTLEMIDRARRRIDIVLDIFPFSPAEVERMQRTIVKAKKRYVIVHIVASQKIHSKDGRTDIREIFPSLLSDIRFFPNILYYGNQIGPTNLFIDHKEVLQLIPRLVEAGVPDLENTVALWVSDTTIVQNTYMPQNEIDRLWEEVVLLEPEFDEEMDGFSAILYKDTVTEKMLRNEGLNERQITALMHVKEGGKITNDEYQEIAHISKSTATRELSTLVKMDLLLRRGITGRGTFYVLKDSQMAQMAHKWLTKGTNNGHD